MDGLSDTARRLGWCIEADVTGKTRKAFTSSHHAQMSCVATMETAKRTMRPLPVGRRVEPTRVDILREGLVLLVLAERR